MNPENGTHLGNISEYPSRYDAGLLVPISRQISRQKLGIDQKLPFSGTDLWNAWELSWLNAKGLPKVAIGLIEVPCTSKNIIESKSIKLYLNSLNQTRFSTEQELLSCLAQDLSECAQGLVKVAIRSVNFGLHNACCTDNSPWSGGIDLDNPDIVCDSYTADPSLLQVQQGQGKVTELLCSNLLKTNCPVTGQPDWATLYVQYSGDKIDHQGLLRYIVSLRQHQDFHENCVEMIFMEIMRHCHPQELAVYARYTRRGGLDINPMRSNFPISADNIVLPRQ